MSDLVMPKLGLTMTEGLVSEWLVKPGDRVKAGDILFVVETEKIANEVEAPADGQVSEIIVPAGSTVPVGEVLARWTGPVLKPAHNAGETDPEETLRRQYQIIAADEIEVTPSRSNNPRVIATPLARRIAAGANIDLATITGSGPRGRIKAGDVDRAIAAASVRDDYASTPTDRSGAAIRAATHSQRVAATRMASAKISIPHFYLGNEVDITRLAALRKELDTGQQQSSYTLTHFILAACAKALIDMPEANAIWSDEGFVDQQSIDIGVATQTDSGLRVPMVRDLSPWPGFAAAAAQMNDVVQRARNGAARPADFGGGALSISNLGMFGVSWAVPIINPPQSAILGVGRNKSVFRPDRNGDPELREEMVIVLSADHRVHDGVSAARLLGRISGYIENPLDLGFG